MKTRNGFVSNSSSSSFIATYGIVKDEGLFYDWKSTCPYFSKYEIMTGAELIKKKEESKWWGPVSSGFLDCMIDENKVYKLAEENPSATFILKTGCGPDGDHEFMSDDDDGWGDLDYDIDLDRFDDEDTEIFASSIEYNGIEVIEQTFYAGRNG
jgi:hypothetical protein